MVSRFDILDAECRQKILTSSNTQVIDLLAWRLPPSERIPAIRRLLELGAPVTLKHLQGLDILSLDWDFLGALLTSSDHELRTTLISMIGEKRARMDAEPTEQPKRSSRVR